MTASEIGGTVVHRYIESYRCGSETAKRAAIDLGQLSDLGDPFSAPETGAVR